MNIEKTNEFVHRLLAVEPRLRAYIRVLVYNVSDVGDLLQDVVTIGLEKYSEFDNSRSFEAWLIGIARYRVLEYIRKQEKRPAPLSNTAIELLASEAEQHSSFADNLHDELEICLGKLTSDDYQLVQARFAKAKNNRDLAKRLGRSEHAIGRSLNRIYAQLLLCIRRRQRGLGVSV